MGNKNIKKNKSKSKNERLSEIKDKEIKDILKEHVAGNTQSDVYEKQEQPSDGQSLPADKKQKKQKNSKIHKEHKNIKKLSGANIEKKETNIQENSLIQSSKTHSIPAKENETKNTKNQTQLDKVANEISDLKTMVADLKNLVADMTEIINNQVKETDVIKSQLSKAHENNVILKSETKNKTVVAENKDIATTNEQVKDLESKIKKLQSEIENLEKEKNCLNEKMITIIKELEVAQENNAELMQKYALTQSELQKHKDVLCIFEKNEQNSRKELLNSIASKLKCEYLDFKSAETLPMTVSLGENMKDQINTIFQILEKNGISMIDHLDFEIEEL